MDQSQCNKSGTSYNACIRNDIYALTYVLPSNLFMLDRLQRDSLEEGLLLLSDEYPNDTVISDLKSDSREAITLTGVFSRKILFLHLLLSCQI